MGGWKMTRLYDGQIADLLRNPGKYNPEIQALSYALCQEKRRIMDAADKTRTMAMIEEIPEEILDVLAVELRTPAYSESFPIDIKRTLIKGTIAFYAQLGTPAAVNWLIRSVFGNGNMEDWYIYGGEPHHFRVVIQNDDTFHSLDGLEEAIRPISAIKRLSSWLDEIVVITDMGEQALRLGGLISTVTQLPIPEAPDTYSFADTLRTGGQLAAVHSVAIPEGATVPTPKNP